jgi:pimeloyl-ACP methyl ester carboxylesterase
MGAGILLQSLASERRWRALVAESPFAQFELVAHDRVRQQVGPVPALPSLVTRAGLLFVRLRYGIDLGTASPEAAITHSNVPVLLIHGTADTSILPYHSQRLAQRRAAWTGLWLVNGVEHSAVMGRHPEEFERRVCEWFRIR